jgi:hypothetical protein
MLRTVYSWILRLHPRSFRQDFGEEMLLIFDEVTRDEVTRDEVAGSSARPRVAEVKLLGDGVVSLVRQWTLRPGFQREPAVAGPTAAAPDGVPRFHVIGTFKPRAAALIHGLILSVAFLCAAFLAMQYSWSHTVQLPFPLVDRGENASSPEQQRAIFPTEATSPPNAIQSPADDSEQVVPVPEPSGSFARGKSQRLQVEPIQADAADTAKDMTIAPVQPAMAATRLRSVYTTSSDVRSNSPMVNRSGFSQPQAQQSKPQDRRATIPAVAEEVNLDAAERRRVLDQAIVNLRQYYFDREVARKTGHALLAHEKSGDDNAVTEGGAFADLLTKQMRYASHDMHLVMEYSRERLPDRPTEQTSESLARYRKAMEQENCGFKKVEILPHNIGYLKLSLFPDTAVCQSTATTAMASLNHADAIIFDLRDNTGGLENMVALIASYLFDHPEYMYSPRESPTERSWTRSPVEGNRLADKPVYVLTSASTWSGAEQFSYDLKMLKRATLVGETTRGGAHAGVFHRIDDHFGMGIPEVKPINPFGRADWEGTGVEPDVRVKAADALEIAEKLAESKLQKK